MGHRSRRGLVRTCTNAHEGGASTQARRDTGGEGTVAVRAEVLQRKKERKKKGRMKGGVDAGGRRAQQAVRARVCEETVRACIGGRRPHGRERAR